MSRDTNQHHAAALAPGQTRRRAWLVLVAQSVALGLFFTTPGARTADSAAALEYKVKGGYLFNFAKFIEWPAASLPTTNSPFIIAVLDGGEAGPVLAQLFAGKTINGHPLQVRSASAASLPNDAHILLVTRAADRTPEELRERLGTAPTLLVGETDKFAERGGTFGFVREGESFRLTLCIEHAAEAGLKVSAKLASVARAVKSKRKN